MRDPTLLWWERNPTTNRKPQKSSWMQKKKKININYEKRKTWIALWKIPPNPMASLKILLICRMVLFVFAEALFVTSYTWRITSLIFFLFFFFFYFSLAHFIRLETISDPLLLLPRLWKRARRTKSKATLWRYQIRSFVVFFAI